MMLVVTKFRAFWRSTSHIRSHIITRSLAAFLAVAGLSTLLFLLYPALSSRDRASEFLFLPSRKLAVRTVSGRAPITPAPSLPTVPATAPVPPPTPPAVSPPTPSEPPSATPPATSPTTPPPTPPEIPQATPPATPPSTPPPTPSEPPSAMPPPNPTPKEDSCVITVDLPIGFASRGKTPEDFVIYSTDSSTRYTVLDAEFVALVSNTVNLVPVYIALLMDQSGSLVGAHVEIVPGVYHHIPGTDPNHLRVAAALQLVNSLEADRFKIGLYVYGEKQEVIPGREVVSFDARSELVAELTKLPQRVGGGTPTFAALLNVLDRFTTLPVDAPKTILCFTDGLADDGALAPAVVAKAQSLKVGISFIALGTKADWTQYRRIAQATGGQLVAVEQASDLSAAFAKLGKQIVEEDRSHYRLKIRAERTGAEFTSGETLSFTVMIRGETKQQAFSVKAK